jgi:hypothetical protein
MPPEGVDGQQQKDHEIQNGIKPYFQQPVDGDRHGFTSARSF